MKKLLLISTVVFGLSACGSEDVQSFPISHASYATLENEVGCESNYSDQKKEDVFNSKYKNHWMTWRGEIVLLEDDNVSLKISGFTQDLHVDFEEDKAGYNLSKGDYIRVKFLMKSAGGCFLPFSGTHAKVL